MDRFLSCPKPSRENVSAKPASKCVETSENNSLSSDSSEIRVLAVVNRKKESSEMQISQQQHEEVMEVEYEITEIEKKSSGTDSKPQNSETDLDKPNLNQEKDSSKEKLEPSTTPLKRPPIEKLSNPPESPSESNSRSVSPTPSSSSVAESNTSSVQICDQSGSRPNSSRDHSRNNPDDEIDEKAEEMDESSPKSSENPTTPKTLRSSATNATTPGGSGGGFSLTPLSERSANMTGKPPMSSSKKRKLTDAERSQRTAELEAKKAKIEQQKREREEKRRLEKEKRDQELEKRQKEKEDREKQKQERLEEKERQKQQKQKEKQEKEEKRLKELEEKQKENEKKLEEKRKKDEERKKKEDEAKEKEQEKLKIKQEEEMKKEKQKNRFMSFFQKDTPKAKRAKLEIETETPSRFLPFELKEGMSLAPRIRRNPEEVDEYDFRSLVFDNEQVKDTSALYIAELKSGSKVPGSSKGTTPKSDDIMCLEDAPDPTGKFKAKFLFFHANNRPAYYGTWRKRSKVVSARKPFGKEEILDYEVDSDEEWEEEPEGDECNSDDEEDDDGEKEDDDDEEDGWLVDHGYLSEGEGDAEEEEEGADAEARRQRLAAKAEAWKVEKLNKKWTRPLCLLIGPYFTHNPSSCPEEQLLAKLKGFSALRVDEKEGVDLPSPIPTSYTEIRIPSHSPQPQITPMVTAAV